MINQLLKQLGFREKETEVYLAVLQHGKIAPASISQITGINRTTVYSIAKELVKRGIMAEDLGGTNRYLTALPAEDLAQLTKKQEKQLAQKKEIIAKAIQELKGFTKNAKYSIPKIVFAAEDDLDNYLYKQSEKWVKSMMKADGIWWGFQDHTFVEHYEKWLDWYWNTGVCQGSQIKLLSNKSDIEQIMKKKKYTRREIKFWNTAQNFTATTWITGDYLIMIVTKQRPHYLVEIHDAVLAHNMRELFKGIWHKLK